MSTSFLKTKFAPPYLKKTTIPREKILGFIQTEDPSFIVIHGPRGYGKTILATQIRQTYISNNRKVVWLNAETGDNTSVTFFRAMFHAFIDSGCEFAKSALTLLKTDNPKTVDKAITAFLNDLIESKLEYNLFVDDFHSIKEKIIFEKLSYLLNSANSHLRLIVVTRTPQIISKLEVNFAKSLVIETSQLQFSYDEAKAFFKLRLPDQKIDADNQRLLFESTEGWISAMDWAAKTILLGGSTRSMSELVFDPKGGLTSKFPSEIFSNLSEEVKTFLLQTSILDSFNVELAKAITNTENVEEIIDQLDSENYFLLRVDGDRNWIRYHSLFLTSLRQELLGKYKEEIGEKAAFARKISSPTGNDLHAYEDVLDDLKKPVFDLYELHRRAAAWYNHYGANEEALKHYLYVNDFDAVAEMLEHTALELLKDGKVNALAEWLQKLPSHAFIGRIRLQYYVAWVYTLTNQIGAARSLIQRLEPEAQSRQEIITDELDSLKAAFNIFADKEEFPGVLTDKWERRGDAFSVAAGCNSQAFSKAFSGQYDQAREIVAWAEQKPELKTLFFPYIYRQSVTAVSYSLEGKFEESNRVARAALDVAEQRHGRRSAPACVLMSLLSDGYYEQDRLLELRDQMSHRYDVINETVYPDALIRAYINGAKTYWALGEPRYSLELLDQLYSYGEEHDFPRAMLSSLAEKLRQSVSANQVNRTRTLFDRLLAFEKSMDPALQGSNSELMLVINRAKSLFHIFLGYPKNAIEILDSLIEFYSPLRRRRLLAKLYLYRATSHLKAGNYVKSEQDFTEALTIGQNCDLRRTFIDYKAWCDALLKQHLGSEYIANSKIEYLNAVLTESKVQKIVAQSKPSSRQNGTQPNIKISNKELEVLSYLSQGLPNKRIALAMNVSPETTRWHLKNIFSKLEVSTRYDAVSRAQTLGIL